MSEPPVTLQAAHDDGPGNLPPTRVVIHATVPGIGYPRASAAGQALSTARYFQSPHSGGSAHYIVDVAGEQHCARDGDICWHAPPNPRSIGIEICAEASYSREQWLSPQVWPAVIRAATRTAELCARFDIPVKRIGPAQLQAGTRGICGHVDVSQAWHQSDHSDPGPGFPWAEFMAAVNGGAPPVSTTSGGFLMALTDAEQAEVLAGIRALKPGLVLPARSANCGSGAKDDYIGSGLNAWAKAADAAATAQQALTEIRALRAALGK